MIQPRKVAKGNPRTINVPRALEHLILGQMEGSKNESHWGEWNAGVSKAFGYTEKNAGRNLNLCSRFK